MEYGNIDDLYQDEPYINDDIMYWGGYLFSCWIFIDDIKGKDIVNNYDIQKILLCYDTLHTVSVKVAIDMIKKDFVLLQDKKIA